MRRNKGKVINSAWVTAICLVLIMAAPGTGVIAQTNGHLKDHVHVNYCKICKKGQHKNDSPYQFGFKKELPFLTASLGLMAGGYLASSLSNEAPFTIKDIEKLDRANLNSFDRSAAYDWNLDAAKKKRSSSEFNGFASRCSII